VAIPVAGLLGDGIPGWNAPRHWRCRAESDRYASDRRLPPLNPRCVRRVQPSRSITRKMTVFPRTSGEAVHSRCDQTLLPILRPPKTGSPGTKHGTPPITTISSTTVFSRTRFLARQFGLPAVDSEIPVGQEIKTAEELKVGLPADNLTILGLAKKLAGEIRTPEASRQERLQTLRKVVRSEPVQVEHPWLLLTRRARAWKRAATGWLSRRTQRYRGLGKGQSRPARQPPQQLCCATTESLRPKRK